MAVAQEKEVPLSAREQETAFARARSLRAAGQPPSVDDATFESYLTGLANAGLADQVGREEIRRYLRWRLSVAVADRMEDIGAGTVARLERDPVLRSALDLLSASTTQNELFAAAARAQPQPGASANLGVIR